MPLAINLESLELTYSFINEYDLAHLLKACPNLRILKYDLWTTLKDVESPEEAAVDLSAFARTLSYVKSTLETLHLHIEKYLWASGAWMDYFDHIVGHMSFKDFPQLSTLHVPLQVLIGDCDTVVDLGEMLPKSLTDLWVNLDGYDFPQEDEPQSAPMYSDEAIIEILSSFLAQWRMYTPSLITLKLLVYQVSRLVWDQWDPDMLANALKPRGYEAGMDLSVDVLPYRCGPRAFYRYQLTGQKPPYFDQEIIEASRMLHNGMNGRNQTMYHN